MGLNAHIPCTGHLAPHRILLLLSDAPQVLAVLKAWEWHDPERLNVNGSGISLGHPIGATGLRILTTMLHELRRRKGRYALETMCIGGGQGLAALFARD